VKNNRLSLWERVRAVCVEKRPFSCDLLSLPSPPAPLPKGEGRIPRHSLSRQGFCTGALEWVGRVRRGRFRRKALTRKGFGNGRMPDLEEQNKKGGAKLAWCKTLAVSVANGGLSWKRDGIPYNGIASPQRHSERIAGTNSSRSVRADPRTFRESLTPGYSHTRHRPPTDP
jgi:hypothetical protein